MSKLAGQGRKGHDPSLYEIAYREAAEALRSQERGIDSLLGRAATVIAAATIATSFLGTRAFERGRSTPWLAWFAVGAFVVVIASCGVVLWPRSWRFGVRAETVIDDSIENATEGSLSPPELRRDLAIHMSRARDENGERSKILVWSLQIAVGALLLEIAAWLGTLR